MTTVHPRSRGEHSARSGCRGSCRRFIPARAGNTISRPSSMAFRTVHPRSRGEHRLARVVLPDPVGSSPLARGTPRTSDGVRDSEPVHPRSRGEHFLTLRTHINDYGSSPLARGTRRSAGGRSSPCIGSSPLARGTLRVVGGTVLVVRFIPARAGNTQHAAPEPGVRPVHPRSRGEHANPARLLLPFTGSSPLARGTQLALVLATLRQRFIPARAGNTAGRQGPEAGAAVHPRSRGEHDQRQSHPGWQLGSSPLARGTPGSRQPERQGQRFIPARAGNTRVVANGQNLQTGSSPLARGTPTVSG